MMVVINVSLKISIYHSQLLKYINFEFQIVGLQSSEGKFYVRRSADF